MDNTIDTTCPDCGTKISVPLRENSNSMIIMGVICPNCCREGIVEDNGDEEEDDSNYFILWP